MIKFEGAISGAAFRRYFMSAVGAGHQLFFVSSPIVFLLTGPISNAIFGDLSIVLLILAALFVGVFFKSKKELRKLTPTLVEVNNEYVKMTSGMGKYCRPICKVKKVIDHGDFYELKFGWILNGGFMKESFICQKDLLTTGSLKKFESLFEGKIHRKKAAEFVGEKYKPSNTKEFKTIEFNGLLTGAAEKRFQKRMRGQRIKLLLAALLLLLPGSLALTLRSLWFPLPLVCAGFIIMLPWACIPSKKVRVALTPKRIYIEEGCIICLAERYTENRDIEEVQLVRDFGEFYELVFPMSKASEKFICQKNLLAKGTLEEFETLFAEKIQRKQETE